MYTAYTDYPFTELGDIPHQEAPVREVTVIGYDQNKYADIVVWGVKTSVKEGYLYATEGRYGEVEKYDIETAFPDPYPENRFKWKEQ